MSIPLINEVNKNDINTSIIAIKKNIERINTLLGLNNTEEIDTSIFATKEELEQAETDLAPVDEVTSGNMHSVTSNAVAQAIEVVQTDSSNMDWTLIRISNGEFIGLGFNKNSYTGTGFYFDAISPTGYTLKYIINGSAFATGNSGNVTRAMHTSGNTIVFYLASGTYEKGQIRVQALYTKD